VEQGNPCIPSETFEMLNSTHTMLRERFIQITSQAPPSILESLKGDIDAVAENIDYISSLFHELTKFLESGELHIGSSGPCMYTGDSCAFAHTVEEMQGTREKEMDRDNLGLLVALLTPNEFEPPFELVASQPQPQPQPQELLMPPPQGNVQNNQSSCIPDLGSVPWHQMDEPVDVTPSNLDNPIGHPNAAVEEGLKCPSMLPCIIKTFGTPA